MDIGFFIDSSGSVGEANFQKCLDFVIELTRAFTISPTDTRVGVVEFSHQAFPLFTFNDYATKAELEAAIRNIKFIGSSTATGHGLKATEELFKDNRRGVPRILIVMTDGQANRGEDLTTPSQELRDAGVIIISVGLGHNYIKDELNTMASKPEAEHVYEAEFSKMGDIVNSIKSRMCKGKIC